MNRDGVWRKSSQSAYDGNCLEVAATFLTVAVRDSKDPDVVLRFPPRGWQEFVDAVKADELSGHSE